MINMRLEKSKQLIQLIDMMKTSSNGVSLEDVTNEFHISYRTAQRLIAVVTNPDLALGVDEIRDFDNKKRWKIPYSRHQKDKYQLTTDDFAVLYQISNMMKTKNASGLNKRLTEILCKLKANTEEQKLSVIENSLPDYMEIEQELFFPYCKDVEEQKLNLLRQACLSFHKIKFEYQEKTYVVEPYGLNTSPTQIILISKFNAVFTEFNVREMQDIQMLPDIFEKEISFSLKTYTSQTIGIFHTNKIYSIELRFAKEVVSSVKNYIFAPEQKMQSNPDGSISVFFKTTGLKGLCHYLIKWEDNVQIISPVELKQEMFNLLQKGYFQLG